MRRLPSRQARARARGASALHRLSPAAQRSAARVRELPPRRGRSSAHERWRDMHRLPPGSRCVARRREVADVHELSSRTRDPRHRALPRLPHRARRQAGRVGRGLRPLPRREGAHGRRLRPRRLRPLPCDRSARTCNATAELRELSSRGDELDARHRPRAVHRVPRERPRAEDGHRDMRELPCGRSGLRAERAPGLCELSPAAHARASDAELHDMPHRQDAGRTRACRTVRELPPRAWSRRCGEVADLRDLPRTGPASRLAPRATARGVRIVPPGARREATRRSRELPGLPPRPRAPRADRRDVHRLPSVRQWHVTMDRISQE